MRSRYTSGVSVSPLAHVILRVIELIMDPGADDARGLNVNRILFSNADSCSTDDGLSDLFSDIPFE